MASPEPLSGPHLGNSVEAQRARVLAALREGPITTMELRNQHDVYSPPPRIFELRHRFGFQIQTEWRWDVDPEGRRHKVGRYTLIEGDQGGE